MGDAVEAVLTGPFGSILHKSDYADDGLPLVNPANIIDEQISRDGIKLVGFQKAKSLKSYELRAGDIVIGRRGEIGRCAVVSNEQVGWLCGTGSFIIRSGKSFDPSFLAAMLRSPTCVSELVNAAAGATMPNLSNGSLSDLRVMVPSLDEQRRIVAVLDKAFADIATATANTQKNLINARALLESTIEGMLAKIPNCRTVSLLDAADSTCSLSYGIVQPGEELDGGLPIVRPTDLRQKFITGENLKSIDPSLAASYKRTTLRGDDLLLCVRGTTGTLSIATPELAGGNVTRGIVPIRFDPDVLSQELGYFLLRSASAQAQIKAATYGTALMQINIGDLKKLELRVPKVEDQSQLADRLNSAQSSIEGLIEIQETKLATFSELKQSLLQKAFAGELT